MGRFLLSFVGRLWRVLGIFILVFEESQLASVTSSVTWRRTLAAQNEEIVVEQARAHLRNAFLSFRKNIAFLASQIASDLRDFTVHDVTHIDALWGLTDLIVGDTYPLSAAEAFILGCSFLVHDLGLALEADPGGLTALKEAPEWPLALKAAFIGVHGRDPRVGEDPELDGVVLQTAVQTLLRSLHAIRASQIASQGFDDDLNRQQIYLLEDAELRVSYGELIGQIAYSHWWDIDKVGQEFQSILGAPADAPDSWRIDPLKIALILRVVDACHLDARRAPLMRRIFQKPQGASRQHWVFQERLQKPYKQNNGLVYSSARSFSVDDADAWWLCYDSLKIADKEIQRANSLLREMNRSEFDVERVLGVEDTTRLQKFIPVSGWKPVDTQVHVGNVAHLVTVLGGEALYGNGPIAPLRELIQNGLDAVNARKIFSDNSFDGKVTVGLKEVEGSFWLTVEDNGLGMSERVIREVLLDFGQSYWTSELILSERREIVERGFQSNGKFGIGFFSIFILGDEVQITTRTEEDSKDSTRVLSIKSGVEGRPILRIARREEQRRSPGTSVSVRLREKSVMDKLLGPGTIQLGSGAGATAVIQLDEAWQLKDLCAWICPCSDVDLFAEMPNGALELAVKANDWLTLDPIELVVRLTPSIPDLVINDFKRHSHRFKRIEDSEGRVIGRGAIYLYNQNSGMAKFTPTGVLTAGSFRAMNLGNWVGLLKGSPTIAARSVASPNVTPIQLRDWLDEERKDIENLALSGSVAKSYAFAIRAFKGDSGSLPIAQTRDGYVKYKDIINIASMFDKILCIDEGMWQFRLQFQPGQLLNEGVVVTSFGRHATGLGPEFDYSFPKDTDFISSQLAYHEGTLQGLVMNALCEAWNCSNYELLKFSGFSAVTQSQYAYISDGPTGPVADRVLVLSKPPTRT